MSDIFHEVDEEVQRERIAKLWKRYQTPLIIAAAFVVAGTGAWTYYDNQRLKTAEAANVRFEAASALAREGKKEEAVAAFEAMAKDAPKGYQTLARMRAADLLAGSDRAKAMAAYDAVADDKGVDKLSQETARLRAALLALEAGDTQQIELRVGSLAAPGAPFRFSAQEWLALDALETGDYDEADRVFNLLLTDRDAPHAMRQRAAIYQALLVAARGPSKSKTPEVSVSQEGATGAAPAPAGDGSLQLVPPPEAK